MLIDNKKEGSKIVQVYMVDATLIGGVISPNENIYMINIDRYYFDTKSLYYFYIHYKYYMIQESENLSPVPQMK